MGSLRRKVAGLVVFLLVAFGAGQLWAVEIDCIQGRPWDSGRVELNTGPNNSPSPKKDLNFHLSRPSDGNPAPNVRQPKTFDVFLSGILSFLGN